MKNTLTTKNKAFDIRKSNLSSLVAFRNSLKTSPFKEVYSSVQSLSRHFLTTLSVSAHNTTDSNGFTYLTDDEFIYEISSEIHEKLENGNKIFTNFVEHLSDDISREGQRRYSDIGYKIPSKNNDNDSYYEILDENRLNIKSKISSVTENFIISYIQKYTSWEFPALEIGVAHSEFTENMIAADPLYLSEIDIQKLYSKLAIFNEVYKFKIRPYYINNDNLDYSALPKNQMSFILAWDVFHTYPKKQLTFMLSQIYDMLTPGGVFLFNYNNCDIPECAKFVEDGILSWMSPTILSNICNEIGLEIEDTYICDELVTVSILKKPGELTTTKTSPPLGKLLYVQELEKINSNSDKIVENNPDNDKTTIAKIRKL